MFSGSLYEIFSALNLWSIGEKLSCKREPYAQDMLYYFYFSTDALWLSVVSATQAS